jgi:hypothetical protein
MHNSDTKKVQNSRNNITHIKDQIKEIEIEDVLIGRSSWLYLIDQYLIIEDLNAWDKAVHLFDKNNFSYITSFGDKGPGPKEITVFGLLNVNETDRILYVSDNGKEQILGFSLDSVLVNPHYFPKEHIQTDRTQHPNNFLYIIGLLLKVTITMT